MPMLSSSWRASEPIRFSRSPPDPMIIPLCASRSTTIVAAFKQLQTAIGTALTQAKNLSTTSPEAFQKGATALGGTVQSSLSGISTSLGKLKSADLEKAAAKEPACTSLNGA